MKTEIPNIRVKKEDEDVKIPLTTGARSSPQKKTKDEEPKSTKNLKGKNKKMLDGQVMASRLEAAGIPMTPHLLGGVNEALYSGGHVGRIFMAETYGGNFIEALPKISPEKIAQHGFKGFLYLTLDLHPAAPLIPGHPGLYFNTHIMGPGEWAHGIMRVITRIQDHPKSVWQYQGQYRLKLSTSITAEEWARQTTTVRNSWASVLQERHWGGIHRARVYGRKHWLRNPTEVEVRDILGRGLDKTITQEEIAGALVRGEDTIAVYTMECVGYDSKFQKDIIKKYKARSLSKSSGSEKAKKRKREEEEEKDVKVPGTSKKNATIRLRAKKTKPNPKKIIVDDAEDEVRFAGSKRLVYIPRGTRSRPARSSNSKPVVIKSLHYY